MKDRLIDIFAGVVFFGSIAAASIMFYMELPKFSEGDCIQNQINGKIGIISSYNNDRYTVIFPNDTYKIPVTMQNNFKKVKCVRK